MLRFALSNPSLRFVVLWFVLSVELSFESCRAVDLYVVAPPAQRNPYDLQPENIDAAGHGQEAAAGQFSHGREPPVRRRTGRERLSAVE